MWPEKKVSQKGALCSVLSFACQFLSKGCIQCPGNLCHGGIVKYFIAASSLNTRKTQWPGTEMWHAKFMWETYLRPRRAYRAAKEGTSERRAISGVGRWEGKLWAPSLPWLGFCHTFTLAWILCKTARDWLLRGRSPVVRTSQDWTAWPPAQIPVVPGRGEKATPDEVWTRPFLWANMPVAFGLMNCAF